MIEASLIVFILFTLVAGAAFAASLDRLVPALWGARPGGLFTALSEGAALLERPVVRTETPDRLTGVLGPAAYLALSIIGLSVTPAASGHVLVDSSVGVVVWGACEALVVVAVFLHGWSPNSLFPLIGAYRYAAIALPMMLPSMFVLIAAALPAESLSLTEIVRSQETVWNVVRQPLGLPLFILTGLTLTLRGPFDFADGADLAGGASAEDSGPARALWQGARLTMMVAFSALAATVFLGGPLGPWLPGPVWLWLKAALIMAVTIAAGTILPRPTPSRMLGLIWTVLLPLSFLHLLWAGGLALW